jgi:UDP-N-acetylmuramoyl-tripeptide--D-alanyl-D-alanine ligase
MNILQLIAIVFWGVVASKQVLFWLYLWQLKEYRVDRMRAHFELPSSRSVFFSQRNAAVLLLLVLSIVAIAVFDSTRSVVVLTVATILFYGFFAARAAEQFQNRSLMRPRLTLRALATLAFAVVLLGAIAVATFLQLARWLLVVLLFADIATPLVVSVAALIFTPAVNVWKKRFLEQARQKRAGLDHLLVIGITGSYGKTSMKEFLATILSQRFRVLKTAENNNTEMGVSRTISDSLSEEHDIFIAEMGAYKRGEIALTSSVAQPTMGVITGIAPQHLSLFGSLQNIQATKYELIEALPEKGLAVFNGDDEYARALFRQCTRPKRLYTTDPLIERSGQSIVVEDVRHTAEGTEMSIKDDRQKEIIITTLLGRHNATNLIGAITVARALGMDYASIKKGVQNIRAPQHTLQLLRGIKGSTVIDDTYSGNINGVFAALEVLKRMRGRQKICILYPLIELGPAAEKAHRDIGAKIGEVCDWCIVTSTDYFAPLYREALENGMSKDSIVALPTMREALRKAQEITDKGDVILLENRVPQGLLDGLVIFNDSMDD